MQFNASIDYVEFALEAVFLHFTTPSGDQFDYHKPAMCSQWTWTSRVGCQSKTGVSNEFSDR